MGKNSKDSHAFIQLVDGVNGKMDYHHFSLDNFSYSRMAFEISIGKNFFSGEKMQLNIENHESSLSGEIEFSNVQALPVSLFSPGIMGWYRFVPMMECYHGIISLDHGLSGSIRLNSNDIDFSRGSGYIEKSWGRSFPTSWIWMQSNHFKQPQTSLFFSLARIPWFGRHFPGFLCLLLIEGKLYKFTTYTGAKVERLELQDHEVFVVVKDKRHILEITASRSDFIILKAPIHGVMERRMSESLNAEVHVSLQTHKGEKLFEGTGTNAGLDIAGEAGELCDG